MNEYLETLAQTKDEAELLDFCRKRLIHGTPHIFANRESEHYSFQKKIATKFGINFGDVLIVGSAKLGFSPRKRKQFDLDSDIDIAIVSKDLFDRTMTYIAEYQMGLRANRPAVSYDELKLYHKFLEYVAIGWIRPDKLPSSFQIKELKKEWFDFFNAISNGKSEAGNYQISAGVFKSLVDLERYLMSDLRSLKIRLQIGDQNVITNKA
jgi:predicted nucleotidyltransferase